MSREEGGREISNIQCSICKVQIRNKYEVESIKRAFIRTLFFYFITQADSGSTLPFLFSALEH
jgi:hypothetical protein